MTTASLPANVHLVAVNDGSALARYVVDIDGQPVGVVQRVVWYAERRTRGQMYVNRRWKAKSPRWEYQLLGEWRSWYGGETRKAAVVRLLEMGRR